MSRRDLAHRLRLQERNQDRFGVDTPLVQVRQRRTRVINVLDR